MNPVSTLPEAGPLVLHLRTLLSRISDQEFYDFCRLHPELQIERSREGDLIVMTPAGGGSGARNFNLAVAFGLWSQANGTGIGFDSSTGFLLPNGAERSPDLAWVRRSRWEALTREEQERFPPLCPDFVVELRSRTDSLPFLQAKMREYIENGACLGWLIDPVQRKLHVYRPGTPIQILDDPASISGDPELPGFVLDLRKLWD